MRAMSAKYCVVLCFFAATSDASIVVDGKISEAEWAGAQHVTDFKLVQPLTGADTPYPTEAWILATPEGLAIGFRNTQTAAVPRTRERTRRDGDAAVDRVNLMVDYDGNGAYNAADQNVSRAAVKTGTPILITKPYRIVDLTGGGGGRDTLARMPEQSTRPSWRQIK